jgi:hypothetical protein
MKRLLLACLVATALWTAACGGGGGSVATPPPPVGGFTNASLKGQYAFVTNGEVFNGAATTPVARTGSFTADGMGGISGGVEDVVEPGVLPNLAVTINNGSYTVNADGRGTLTLNVTSGGIPSSINFGIVLTSTNDGLMIDETSTATQASTGSGNFLKQNTTAFTNPVLPVTASYVFDFSGLDANMFPDSFVGEFTAGSGAISAGVEDVNANFVLTSSAIIPPGTLTQDPADTSSLTSFGRGVAQIAGESYVFYIVDSTRIRFISTGGGAMFTGDAVIQDNTIPKTVSNINSGFVFIVAGSSGSGGGLTRVGRFTANSSSVSNVLVDTNNAGMFTPTNGATAATITLDPANPGRGTVTFLGNGLGSPFIFVFYLSSATQGVIQETTLSGGAPIAVADGTIAAQSGGPFSSSNITGTYALNWSGQSLQSGVFDEEDLVGQVTASSFNLTGAADIFQFTGGAPQTNAVVGGSVMIDGDGTGGSGLRNNMTVTLTSSSAASVHFVVYFVSPQLAFFANDNNQGTTRIVAGILEVQKTP